MLRILYVCHDPIDPIDNGGIFDQRYFYENLIKLGHNVDLIYTKRKNQKDNSKSFSNNSSCVERNYNVLQFLTLKPFQLTSRSNLTKIKFKEKYDIVITTEHCSIVLQNQTLEYRYAVLRRNNIESSYAYNEFKYASFFKKIFFLREYLMWKIQEFLYRSKPYIHLFVSETEMNKSMGLKSKHYLPAQTNFHSSADYNFHKPILGFIGSLDIHDNFLAAQLLQDFAKENEETAIYIAGRCKSEGSDHIITDENLTIHYNFTCAEKAWKRFNMFVVLSSHSLGVKVKIIEAMGRGKVIFACKNALAGMPKGVESCCIQTDSESLKSDIKKFLNLNHEEKENMMKEIKNFYEKHFSSKSKLEKMLGEII